MSAFNILQSILGAAKTSTSSNGGNLLNQISSLGTKAIQGSQLGSNVNLAKLGGLGSLVGGIWNELSSNQKTALGAGALAVLLGQKSHSNLVKIGGLAALGTVAYQAYTNWQTKQKQAGNLTPEQDINFPQSLESLPDASKEETSKALLVAMINAVKADGVISDEEQALLDEQFKTISNPQELAWLKEEMSKPLDPNNVAQYVNSPQLATQVYAMTLTLIPGRNFMEEAYLNALANKLNIDDSLRAELEQQIKQQLG